MLFRSCVEILKNRSRIVPLVLVKYGEKNGKMLFGINFVNQTIWEFLGQDEFINVNLLEKMEELNKKCERLEKMIQNK